MLFTSGVSGRFADKSLFCLFFVVNDFKIIDFFDSVLAVVIILMTIRSLLY